MAMATEIMSQQPLMCKRVRAYVASKYIPTKTFSYAFHGDSFLAFKSLYAWDSVL